MLLKTRGELLTLIESRGLNFTPTIYPNLSRSSCRCHGACQAAESQQPDKMKQFSLKTAPTATIKEQKSQNRPKAKRIVIGVDVHLKSYHAACKIDNGAIGAVAKFRSQTE